MPRHDHEVEEKSRLRYFIKWHSDLMNYVTGDGNFVPAFSPKEWKEFRTLARRWKFNEEFADALSGVKFPKGR